MEEGDFMELNRKILKMGIIIISLSIIISLGLAMFMKLDKPVFFKNYIETMLEVSSNSYREDEFVLKYITNISDKRRITDIILRNILTLCYMQGTIVVGEIYFLYFYGVAILEKKSMVDMLFENLYVTMDIRSLGELMKLN